MKRKLAALSIIPACLAALVLYAQTVPTKVSYQGRITDDTGMPLASSTVDMDFAVYSALSGGTALWTESQSNIDVDGGLYNVELGAANPLGPSVFSCGQAWLEVAVEGDTLSPRQPMLSVPYSYSAQSLASDDYVLNTGDTVDGALAINGALFIGQQSADSVGIMFSSTNAPDYGAMIFAEDIGLYALRTGSTVSTYAVLASLNTGVYGSSGDSVTTNTQIGGSFGAKSAGSAIGLSAGADGYGPSPARGVMSIVNGHDAGEATGGYFLVTDTGSGTHYGVQGHVLDPDGVHYGLYGRVNSPESYGVYSEGNGFIDGNLAIASISQDRRTKKQIGSLRWHEANTVASSNPFGAGLWAAAFDGAGNMGFTMNSGSNAYKIGTDLSSPVGMGSFANPARGIAHDGVDFWVASMGGNYVRNVTGGGSVTVGTNPVGLCFDGQYLYAANSNSGSVSVVDPTTNTVVTAIGMGGSPYWCACTYDYVWVTDQGGLLHKIDPNVMGVVATYAIGPSPAGIAFDGQNLWVADNAMSGVLKIEESTGNILATVGAGGGTMGVVFDGAHIWATGNLSNTITKIRAIDATVINTYPTCTAPGMPAFDGVHVWVPCQSGGFNKM